MFRPDSNRDRTDYSGILMPPDGYRLDRAVGTTYSLDLEALTAVAICLGLSEETDSKLMQNPIKFSLSDYVEKKASLSPFDRILISQAKTEGARIISHDLNFENYDEKCILMI